MSETDVLVPRHSEEQETKDYKISKWRRFMIFPLLLLAFLGEGMESYITNEWTHSRLQNSMTGNETIDKGNFTGCNSPNHSDPKYLLFVRIQQKNAEWQMYYSVTYLTCTFVSNLLLPSYTDQYGRKFLLGLSVFGMFIREVIISFVIYTNQELFYIVLANAIGGLLGGYYGFQAVVFAYISDITEGRGSRTIGIAVVEGLDKVLIAFSSLGTGLLIRYTSYFYSAISSGGLLLVSCFAVLCLPETVATGNKMAIDTSVLKIFKNTFVFYSSSEFKNKRCNYLLLAAAFAFYELSSSHRSSIETTFQQGMPFCWKSTLIGYFSSLRHAGQGLIGIGSIRILQKCFRDEFLAIASTVLNAGSFLVEALATTDAMLFTAAAMAFYSFLTPPLIRAIMSLMTSADRQGAMFAGLSLAQAVCSVFAVVIDNSIYADTVEFMHGFVFLWMAGINAVTFIFLLLFACRKLRKSPEPDDSINQQGILK